MILITMIFMAVFLILMLETTREKTGKNHTSCPYCDKQIEESYVFCPYCSSPLKKTCINCGTFIKPFWKVCPNCGTKVAKGGDE
jgi:RNA polymerase subunit RPABC4/transcription elongation factor Spt4